MLRRSRGRRELPTTPNPSDQDPGQAGFTLVEVLVATVLMAVALIVIASVFPAGRLSQKKAEYLAIAASVAQDKMEHLRGAEFESVQVGTTSATDPRLPDGNTLTTEITYFPTSGDPDLKKVRVAVRWPGGAVPWLGGHVRYETLIANR